MLTDHDAGLVFVFMNNLEAERFGLVLFLKMLSFIFFV